jgi:hypothetical protein
LEIPNVLANSFNHDSSLLHERQRIVEAGKNKGNTREVSFYKKLLPKKLTPVQMEWSVGLALSDSSIQNNANGKAFRFKIQQADYHAPFLSVTRGLFAPFFLGPTTKFKKKGPAAQKFEIQTVRCEAMVEFAELLKDDSVPLKPNACVQKTIKPQIQKY